MKSLKLLLAVFLLLSGKLYSQQKLRMSSDMMLSIVIPVNPADTLFQSFKMFDSQKAVAPFFKALPEAKFYSLAELEEMKLRIDKLFNPDKYFSIKNDYDAFVETWINELTTERKRIMK